MRKMPAGRSSGSRRWPPFIPSQEGPGGSHEGRVAYSCWAAPVFHRIPEHLWAVLAVEMLHRSYGQTTLSFAREKRVVHDFMGGGAPRRKKRVCPPPNPRGSAEYQAPQVGLLASGSIYSRPLPSRMRQWRRPFSSPVTVAGPRWIFTSFPGLSRGKPTCCASK